MHIFVRIVTQSALIHLIFPSQNAANLKASHHGKVLTFEVSVNMRDASFVLWVPSSVL